MKKTKKTISFLASGQGSNFEAVAQKILHKQIKAKIGILIIDKANAPAKEIAEKLNIPVYFIDPQKYKNKNDYEQEIILKLKEFKTDLVVAAGFMRILSSTFLNEYQNRAINIHPSLLPSFPGLNAQRQALKYGVKITGCTVHFIDQGTDTGTIILQKAVKIEDNDTEATLAERILKYEHQILPEAVKLFCLEKIEIKEKKVYRK